MESALREVGSWTESNFDKEYLNFEIAVIKANLYRTADTNILPNNECHEVLSRTFDKLAEKAAQNFAEARALQRRTKAAVIGAAALR
jgi:hypothetical protein